MASSTSLCMRGMACTRAQEDVKSYGAKLVEFSNEELETMFGMFDITGKGSVTAKQCNEAVKTLTGRDGPLNEDEGKRAYSQEEFVSIVSSSLQ